ncbi:hypothetical protein DFH05DRAFT_1544335 [Lentinula detonsa]|uniref:Uncharacterized protein n=1 Tax=Lentinula detonsa TaxID=2804962 RepID=A0A9W8NY83_9AGAR|nr:hypothetical protein DFH05DRAFT_1544335 [Lentinula detonsa]
MDTPREPSLEEMKALFARRGVSLSSSQLYMLEHGAEEVPTSDSDQVKKTTPTLPNDSVNDENMKQESNKDKGEDIDNATEKVASRLSTLIDSLLQSYNSQMEKLAMDQIQIPFWEPELPEIDDDIRQFIRGLKLPRARAPNEHIPDMLLHKLGRFQDNKEMKANLKSLLGTKKHKVFVNTSGSGKTRMILEHLCTHWGIYLTCHEESRIGSSDLVYAISAMKGRLKRLHHTTIVEVTHEELARFSSESGKVCTEQQYIRARFKNKEDKKLFLRSFRSSSEGDRFLEPLQNNQNVVDFELLVLFLARLSVLQKFGLTLQKLKKDTTCMFHKRQWLYLQLHPELASIEEQKPVDIFGELIQHIKRFLDQEKIDTKTQIDILTTVMNRTFSVIKRTLLSRYMFRSSQRLLHVAVDECQIIADDMQHCFLSDSWLIKRSLLRQLARSMDIMLNGKRPQAHTSEACFVFTGTGLSRALINEALSSVIAKPGLTTNVSQTGAFNNPIAQLEYMKELFPPRIFEDPDFEQLRRRIFYWLQGRHRFTAEYMSVVLQNGYRHLEQVLNFYIAALCDFRPADYNGSEMINGNIVWPSKGFEFERLDTEMRDRIKTISHEYLFTSKVPYSKQEAITLDEPLVLLACSIYFNNQPTKSVTSIYKTIASRIQDHNPSTGRNGFEEFICFYLQHIFRLPRKLNEVFNFKDENDIGEKLATLVNLHINYNGRECKLMEGKINLVGEPTVSGPVGQRIESEWKQGSSSLQDWIQLRYHTAFCFPMNAMGPDILCFLKLHNDVADKEDFTYICLAIQCKFYQLSSLKPITLREAIATITPSKFFQKRKAATDPASTKQMVNREEARDQFLQALADIPCKDPQAGKYGVIRIVCGFPVLIDLDKAFIARGKDVREEGSTSNKRRLVEWPDPDGTDGHPLGTFNTSLLSAETRIFHPTEILEIIKKRAFESPSLVLDTDTPGVVGIDSLINLEAKDVQMNQPRWAGGADYKLLQMEAAGDQNIRLSKLATEGEPIIPKVTGKVLTMLKADHSHWGSSLHLKRKLKTQT